MANPEFYQQLPVQRLPLAHLLGDTGTFTPVPEDWTVVITDIIGSTRAVKTGRHQEVNLTATGSIVAVLNIAFAQNRVIPFFFGGDGATFILPPEIINEAMAALASYQAHVLELYGFELRSGKVTVTEIYAQGHQLLLAKYQSSPNLVIPILLGNGLTYAEKIIKGEDNLHITGSHQQDELNLSGMQCRWDRIPPPVEQDEVITLLVIAREENQQAVIFQKVMDKLDQLYGSPQKRQPISIARLKLKTSFQVIQKELRARLGKFGWLETVRNWLVNLLGPLFFRTKSGKQYLKTLVEMSDTLVIDGKINTVITGKALQRIALENFLKELESTGEISYGLHVSDAAVMSCYVRDLKYHHIHFVDGAEGGYTQAASTLKGKVIKPVSQI